MSGVTATDPRRGRSIAALRQASPTCSSSCRPYLAIFLFPVLFSAIGQGNATLFVAIFPLIGLLAAIFILPEVYGYHDD